MALRLLMVGLVAGLGLDLPSGRDVGRWARDGRAWLERTVAALSPAPMPDDAGAFAAEAPEPDAPIAATGPVVPVAPTLAAEIVLAKTSGGMDRDFSAVVDQMAVDFAADRPILAESRPRPSFEPVEVGDDLYPGLAFDLNGGAEALGVAQGAAAANSRDDPASPAEESRERKLTAALRLTGQAFHAWVSVLQHGPSVAATRP